MKPNICLSMIVKNEFKVIERCLESVKPFINSWVIVDTGSTDGTQAKVRELMKDIPGKLHERPWRNFGHNRTEALQLASTFSGALVGPDHYNLVIDADDILTEVTPILQFNMLDKFDCYDLKVEDHGTSYYRPHLFRADMPFFYKGVLHEYLDCGEVLNDSNKTFVHRPFTKAIFSGLTYTRLGGGGRSADPKKYKKDAMVLREALRSEPHNERYAFYLAQSLRDAGDLRGAVIAYQKRANMPGWAEETWMALYEVGCLSVALKYAPSTISDAFLKAYKFRPSRAESIYQLARYYRTMENFPLAFLFAKAALGIPLPEDKLFIDESIYNWRILDEYSISAYYVGYKEEALAADQKLILEGWRNIPEDELERIRNNMKFV